MKKNRTTVALVLAVLCVSLLASGCNYKNTSKHHERKTRHEHTSSRDNDRNENTNSENRVLKGETMQATEVIIDIEEPEEPDSNEINSPYADPRTAFEQAQDYLTYMSFSRSELIDQLQYTHTYEDSVAAVEQLEAEGLVDWNEQAYNQAKHYIDSCGISRQELYDLLAGDYGYGYSASEANYALTRLEDENYVDWNEEAFESAVEYLEIDDFTRERMIYQLTSEFGGRFTEEQAEYAVDRLNLQ